MAVRIALVLMVVTILAGCGGQQQNAPADRPEPSLRIINPKPNGVSEVIDARTNKSSIRLEGELRDAPQGRVTVNGQPVSINMSDGRFSKVVPLRDGGNIFRVEATVPGRTPLVEEVNVTRTLTDRQRAEAERELNRRIERTRREAEQAEAQEEQEFRAEAIRIDPKELIKSPDEYAGERVVYEGQIFQIFEETGLRRSCCR